MNITPWEILEIARLRHEVRTLRTWLLVAALVIGGLVVLGAP
jgi:hypothetical protein